MNCLWCSRPFDIYLWVANSVKLYSCSGHADDTEALVWAIGARRGINLGDAYDPEAFNALSKWLAQIDESETAKDEARSDPSAWPTAPFRWDIPQGPSWEESERYKGRP